MPRQKIPPQNSFNQIDAGRLYIMLIANTVFLLLFQYKHFQSIKLNVPDLLPSLYTEGSKKMYSLFDSQYLWNKMTCSYNSCAVV
jgi:hypothetical protein